MNALKLRSINCICSKDSIFRREPEWLCSCTATILKTQILQKKSRKRGIKTLINLTFEEVTDSGKVAEKKLKDIWQLKPEVFSEEVQKQLRHQEQVKKEEKERVEEEKAKAKREKQLAKDFAKQLKEKEELLAAEERERIRQLEELAKKEEEEQREKLEAERLAKELKDLEDQLRREREEQEREELEREAEELARLEEEARKEEAAKKLAETLRLVLLAKEAEKKEAERLLLLAKQQREEQQRQDRLREQKAREEAAKQAGAMASSGDPDYTKISDALQEALTAALSETVVTSVSAILTHLQDIYKYHGFDVKEIRQVFMSWYADIPINTKIDLGGGQELLVGGPKNLRNCLSLLAFFYNYRGNNMTNIIDGLEGAQKSTLQDLVTKLHIKDRVIEKKGDKGATSKKSKYTLTLSRIAAAFPLYAMRVVTCKEYNRKVIDMSDASVDQGLPVYRALCHPLAGSMLTKGLRKDGYVYITFLAAMKFNAVIGPKSSKADPSTVWTYHKAVLGSEATPEDHKEAFWESLTALDKVDVEALKTKLKGMGVSEQVMVELEEYSS